jgi:Flp pilus assembly protein TadG
MRSASVGRARLHRQDGASAVELALIAPLLFMLVFGIIGFGLAFLQVQSVRTAVREGGRAAAVGASVSQTRQKTVDASSGAIPSGLQGDVQVNPNPQSGPVCTSNNIGSDATVWFDTQNLNGGTGIVVRIPLLPDIHITPVITASFRCEV